MVEKDFLEGHLVPVDSNECTYTPKLVVEYKGIIKETTDIKEDSYETLLEEAKKEYTSNNKDKDTSKEETKSNIEEKVDEFISKIKENKTLTIIASVLGGITGLMLIYLLYKLIRKCIRWVRK